jgi:radical SAM-linked protein
MRTFQRAFKRAGIQIRHAGAFNPHPFISVAIPLSLGYSSVCELMDFGLESGCTLEEVAEKLNPVLPEGLTVIKAYDATRPTKEIGKLVWELEFIYDNGIPDGAEEGLNELFSRPELVMQKKSKKAKSGFTTVDLIPLIGRHSMKRRDNVLCLTIDLAGQNPGLNPNLLQDAIEQEYPALKPDFLRACRLDILDGEGNRFEGDLRD